jgi:CheY-like chemotaxis protein
MSRYLLLDDNPAFAENLAEILRDLGHEVTVTHSGQEALSVVRRECFDVLITDMRMPGMSGADAVHEVRRIDPGLAAVVITAHPGERDLQNARREGILAVLPKPVPVETLVDLLRDARRNGLVAVVEDDLELAENLADVLRSRGFSVVNAASLEDVEQVSKTSPFAALVDMRVPGGPDGAAVQSLRRSRPDLPLLVMTALADAPPADDVPVLRKPFSPDTLLTLLEEIHRERSRS